MSTTTQTKIAANASADEDSELPEGWGWCNMEDVTQIVTSGSRDWSKFYSDRGAYFVRSAEINDYTLRLSEAIHVALPSKIEGKRSLIEKDDILITITGANVGKCAKVDTTIPEAYVSQSVALIKLISRKLAPFVYYALRAPAVGGRQFEEMAYGLGRPVLSLPQIRSLRIPLAPVPEQKRIISKIVELFKQVNASRDHLARVATILRRFRQSVLAAACSGRLTEDWRHKHSAVENAEASLQRHRQKRRDALGSIKPRTKQIGILVEPIFGDKFRTVDESPLPEIPDTWTWAYLADVGFMNRGTSRHRPRNAPHLFGGPYPFIQTGDIAQSGGRLTSHEQTYSEAGLAQSRLWPADTVCITIAANIADSALLTYPSCFPDSVVGVITDHAICLAKYLEFFVRTARADLAQYAPATAQANINIAILNNVAVPLPAIPEQCEIVHRVEALFKLADMIEKRVEGATKRADKLTQAILAKAFRGELVPTEAELARHEGRDYEPASMLLERIKAERESSATSQSDGKRPRRIKSRKK